MPACLPSIMGGTVYVKTLVLAAALLGWLVASLIAFVVVALVGFLGIALAGLFIAFVSTQVELESGGIAGGAYGTDMIRQQTQAERAMSGEQRVNKRHEESLAVQSARFFKHLGLGLALIGLGGFAYNYL